MSSGSPKIRVASTIRFRIAAGCALLVLASSLSLMAIAYWFLASALARNDREQITAELQSLRQEYLDGGLDSFVQAVQENDRFRRNNPFFTRITAGTGGSGRIFFPQYWREFDLATLESGGPAMEADWIILTARSGGHRLEIREAAFSDGFRFQVGISTEDRRRTLMRLQETFYFAWLGDAWVANLFAPLILGLSTFGCAFIVKFAIISIA